MSTIFAPITDQTYLGADAMLCEATVRLDGGTAMSAESTPVTEMIEEQKIGKLRFCRVIDGVLKAAFEVWNSTAIEKIRHGVYAGVALVGLSDGAEFSLERCALVDRPDALSKSRGTTAAFLYVDGVTKMALPNAHQATAAAAANPFTKIEVGANTREANERSVMLIKYALSPAVGRIKLARDADFLNWLRARAGR